MPGNKMFTVEEAHQEFARSLNGKAWELLDKADRTPSENDLMIHAAHGSCYHWLQVGTGLHHQRAEWLISHVYAVLGRSEPALKHAARCLELTEEYAGLMKDFDRAYAYEALARANALAGNPDQAATYIRLADEAGRTIFDQEDRDIFLGDFDGGDWQGLR